MTALRVHGTTVAVDGCGVMIVGPSGAGKSDLALRLIDRGAVLVSDDYTDCIVRDGVVVASAPPTIAGRIEVRGIGIVAVPSAAETPVSLVVALGESVERMPEPYPKRVAGVDIPAIALAAFEASTPIKVEIALSRLVRD